MRLKEDLFIYRVRKSLRFLLWDAVFIVTIVTLISIYYDWNLDIIIWGVLIGKLGLWLIPSIALHINHLGYAKGTTCRFCTEDQMLQVYQKQQNITVPISNISEVELRICRKIHTDDYLRHTSQEYYYMKVHLKEPDAHSPIILTNLLIPKLEKVWDAFAPDVKKRVVYRNYNWIAEH